MFFVAAKLYDKDCSAIVRAILTLYKMAVHSNQQDDEDYT